jgi:hypothetical protein
MNERPGRRNAELDAFDRELRGVSGEEERKAPERQWPGSDDRGSDAPRQDPLALVDADAPQDPSEGVSHEVLARDLIIFQVKLLLDGLKDLVLSPLSIMAVLWDLVPSRNAPRGRAFYQVLKIGERFDLWLNLYNPSSRERQDHEGLLEAGVHSADSLMGKLEQLAREEAGRQTKGKAKKGGWGNGA